MMSGDERSELPLHYGATLADGEVVKRPHDKGGIGADRTPPSFPYDRRGMSPPRTPFNTLHPDIDGLHPGVRRRSSSQPIGRRHSNAGDYSRTFRESQRGHRARDDGYYQDRDRDHDRDRDDGQFYNRGHYRDSRDRDRDRNRDDFRYHHDFNKRRSHSRPPRSHLNHESYYDDRFFKPYVEETRDEYRERPAPRGRPLSSDESIDGYNYDGAPKKSMDVNNLSKEQLAMAMRLPWTHWMNSSTKNHFVATIGEFVGTTMFLFFAFAGTQVANLGSQASTGSSTTAGSTSGGATGFNISVYLYISIIFGFSLMVNVWVFFRISGGLFNPAVTLAMVLTGAVPVVRAVFLFVAQITGGIAASAMVRGLFPTPLNVRTTLAGGASLVQGIFIEAILTAELVFTIFMLAKEKHKATFIAPVGIGLALFIAEMVGVYYTGGSLNPARSFGPCVVTSTFDPEHWIYWVGPTIGSLIAVFFYKFIKMLEYEMANPGQDGDARNDPTKNKEKAAEIRSESRRG